MMAVKKPKDEKPGRPTGANREYFDPTGIKVGHFYVMKPKEVVVKIEKKTPSVNGDDIWWFVYNTVTKKGKILVTDVRKFIREVPNPSKKEKTDAPDPEEVTTNEITNTNAFPEYPTVREDAAPAS